jgi:hypothetical protein
MNVQAPEFGISRPAAAPSLVAVSCGLGIQSTTMVLMAAHGLIKPMPDVAFFADTGDEPGDVYEHLDWLSGGNVLPFPVVRLAPARSLSAALRAGDDAARIPCHVGAGGLSGRQCTRNWKIRPLRRAARDRLGVSARGYVRPGAVEQWVGISTDEVVRLKPSGCSYIHNRHPLIELRMSQWRRIKSRPDDWAKAVGVDEWLGEPAQVERFRGRLFIHQSRVPLADADLVGVDPLQHDLFGNECEGVCGV